MILQALQRYYERADGLPCEGWVRRGVDYVLVLDEQGQCINIESVGEQKQGKTISRDMLVPAIGKQAMKHTNSGQDANLLWDNASFVFGTGNKGDKKITAFLGTMHSWVGDLGDTGVAAVINFCTGLQAKPDSLAPLLKRFEVSEDFAKRDPVLVFRLISDIESIHARPQVRAAYESKLALTHSETPLCGNCLVTGAIGVPLASNETVIKNVWGGQTSGANIVSFNARAFESYGKRERNGENAPIGLQASFAYTTALNHLLGKGSRQRIQVGDASTVFWAEEAHDLETQIPDLFGEPPKDEPDRGADALKALYQAIQTGQFAVGEPTTRFHVLGLAPNAARISIRFWETAPALDLARRIQRHFEDLRIARGPNDPEHLSLFRLLASCAVQGKADNIPPNLGGDVMRAVLEDLSYPATLLNAAVQRSRAEQRVTYPRAAILKAWLNRDIRRTNRDRSDSVKEIQPMLDPANPNPAYRLGRLFATLEKIQEEASPGLNATIRDRYYGAASSTPVAVFTTLLRLKNHHLGKLNAGRAVQMERLVGEILSDVEDFPRHLALPEQGRFALGYYHQRQAFFTKSESPAHKTDNKEQES
ncbi:type I-C CRISPR-associated protein Cas8c/Csd1 [Thiocystis violacea]|uniref:type I-C CRISPR-associated protein Cas8c/Csd1 n=1 Tax=Thiocystis violacea TaxID=13725 RepID=UPI0019039CFF|nr:type I-C CRISPR-associated protein Cas8c/Csd1 [Thiocystis violacea]MBK1718601.1 type I-C CRISPR-associated protein Cas8c/Csd1 [Thiocystis violacea]